MKKYFFFLIFLITTFSAIAQNASDIIDNLKKELSTSPDAKRTASIYSDLTWYYSNIATDSAISYGNKAIAESIKLKDSVLLAQVYSDLGAVYFRKTDYKSSKASYLTAYQIRKNRGDKIGMAKVAANLANIYNKENKKTLALKSYLESVDYFEKTNNLGAAAITNANIGSLFMDLKNYSKSMSYTRKAINYQEENHQDIGLSTSYLTMGNIYLKLKDTVNALKYYSKSIAYSKKTANNLALSAAFNNISNIKIQQKKGLEASKLIEKSGEIIKKLNVNTDESSLALNQVSKDISEKKFLEAQSILYKLKNRYNKNDLFKSELWQTYIYLSQTHSYLNKPDSASYYIEASMKLQDEIVEKTVRKQTNELETKYQTEKKEQLLLQKEAEAKQKNVLLVGISSLLALIVIIAFLIYRQQRLKNRQQEQEFQLKSAIAQIEKQNELQEQRLTISRDLHDNIGAQLTFIISSVENIKYAFDITNEKLDTKLQGISAFARSTILELRDTIWAMNNNEIHFEDLRARILDFIEKAKIAKEDIDFKFNIQDSVHQEKLSSITGMNIYRTIQEAVNNAIKYADASLITIDVKTIEDKITIHIQDNGKGFEEDKVEKGNGLLNMQKRIEDIGGIFNLISAPGKGTTIELFLNKKNSL